MGIMKTRRKIQTDFLCNVRYESLFGDDSEEPKKD